MSITSLDSPSAFTTIIRTYLGIPFQTDSSWTTPDQTQTITVTLIGILMSIRGTLMWRKRPRRRNRGIDANTTSNTSSNNNNETDHHQNSNSNSKIDNNDKAELPGHGQEKAPDRHNSEPINKSNPPRT